MYMRLGSPLLLFLCPALIRAALKKECQGLIGTTFQSGGREREYAVEVPPGGATPKGLIVALHGTGDTGPGNCCQMPASKVAAATGAVVVCPSAFFPSVDNKKDEKGKKTCDSTGKAFCDENCKTGSESSLCATDVKQWCDEHCKDEPKAEPSTKESSENCPASKSSKGDRRMQSKNQTDDKKMDPKSKEDDKKMDSKSKDDDKKMDPKSKDDDKKMDSKSKLESKKEPGCWQAFPGGDDSCPEAAGTDDLLFLEELVEHIMQKYSIPKGNTFVGGFSKGGSMAYRVLCAAPDYANGVIVVAMEWFDPWLGFWKREGTGKCNPEKKPPVYAMVGTKDRYAQEFYMQSWGKFSEEVYNCKAGSKSVMYEDPDYQYGHVKCEEFSQCAEFNQMCSVKCADHDDMQDYAYTSAFAKWAKPLPTTTTTEAATVDKAGNAVTWAWIGVLIVWLMYYAEH